VERRLVKRTFDVTMSVAALLLLSPVLLSIAVWVKLDSKGSVLYSGERIGRFGKPFRMRKFRTMVANAEAIGGPNTPQDDPRITRLGHFLRRHKLDELPQFINVLNGTMSIVGPRPEVPQYVELFSDEEREVLLSVRPGITDLATLWNSDESSLLEGSEDPEKMYFEQIWPEKHRLQLEYVRNRSLWLDIKIILLTAKGMTIDRFWHTHDPASAA
jgi:lipopolysaccharide/colanic/teichoic acid biosynthesis glycosyltransferase